MLGSEGGRALARRCAERLVSAGGIVYRGRPGGLEVLLCGRLNPTVWGLPKGTPDTGESLEATAAREVREETGVDVALEGKAGSIDYWFQSPDNILYHKTVHFYFMVPKGGSTDLHDAEYDVVQWFPLEEAMATLTYKNEVDLVRQAMASVPEKVLRNS